MDIKDTINTDLSDNSIKERQENATLEDKIPSEHLDKIDKTEKDEIEKINKNDLNKVNEENDKHNRTNLDTSSNNNNFSTNENEINQQITPVPNFISDQNSLIPNLPEKISENPASENENEVNEKNSSTIIETEKKDKDFQNNESKNLEKKISINVKYNVPPSQKANNRANSSEPLYIEVKGLLEVLNVQDFAKNIGIKNPTLSGKSENPLTSKRSYSVPAKVASKNVPKDINKQSYKNGSPYKIEGLPKSTNTQKKPPLLLKNSLKQAYVVKKPIDSKSATIGKPLDTNKEKSTFRILPKKNNTSNESKIHPKSLNKSNIVPSKVISNEEKEINNPSKTEKSFIKTSPKVIPLLNKEKNVKHKVPFKASAKKTLEDIKNSLEKKNKEVHGFEKPRDAINDLNQEKKSSFISRKFVMKPKFTMKSISLKKESAKKAKDLLDAKKMLVKKPVSKLVNQLKPKEKDRKKKIQDKDTQDKKGKLLKDLTEKDDLKKKDNKYIDQSKSEGEKEVDTKREEIDEGKKEIISDDKNEPEIKKEKLNICEKESEAEKEDKTLDDKKEPEMEKEDIALDDKKEPEMEKEEKKLDDIEESETEEKKLDDKKEPEIEKEKKLDDIEESETEGKKLDDKKEPEIEKEEKKLDDIEESETEEKKLDDKKEPEMEKEDITLDDKREPKMEKEENKLDDIKESETEEKKLDDKKESETEKEIPKNSKEIEKKKIDIKKSVDLKLNRKVPKKIDNILLKKQDVKNPLGLKQRGAVKNNAIAFKSKIEVDGNSKEKKNFKNENTSDLAKISINKFLPQRKIAPMKKSIDLKKVSVTKSTMKEEDKKKQGKMINGLLNPTEMKKDLKTDSYNNKNISKTISTTLSKSNISIFKKKILGKSKTEDIHEIKSNKNKTPSSKSENNENVSEQDKIKKKDELNENRLFNKKALFKNRKTLSSKLSKLNGKSNTSSIKKLSSFGDIKNKKTVLVKNAMSSKGIFEKNKVNDSLKEAKPIKKLKSKVTKKINMSDILNKEDKLMKKIPKKIKSIPSQVKLDKKMRKIKIENLPKGTSNILKMKDKKILKKSKVINDDEITDIDKNNELSEYAPGKIKTTKDKGKNNYLTPRIGIHEPKNMNDQLNMSTSNSSVKLTPRSITPFSSSKRLKKNKNKIDSLSIDDALKEKLIYMNASKNPLDPNMKDMHFKYIPKLELPQLSLINTDKINKKDESKRRNQSVGNQGLSNLYEKPSFNFNSNKSTVSLRDLSLHMNFNPSKELIREGPYIHINNLRDQNTIFKKADNEKQNSNWIFSKCCNTNKNKNFYERKEPIIQNFSSLFNVNNKYIPYAYTSEVIENPSNNIKMSNIYGSDLFTSNIRNQVLLNNNCNTSGYMNNPNLSKFTLRLKKVPSGSRKTTYCNCI
ncbi:conserved Plasmodium protein, unknown function [Plasmodium relictum]|uniref:Uncharacterized protein n=1 Tax=Plasmodium relictum TaxID=85471 RepID=A0A1J1H898_PLARL|nr:conserved Plasmodium protein, unknown function [Plasmodium relictum]CRH01123.1 conserved Plasmodium protein, unknown function [Plasmodium relictum]